MRRCCLALLLAFVALASNQLPVVRAVPHEPPGTGGTLSWIWCPEVQVGTAYFRATFEIPRPLQRPTDEAVLHVAADNEAVVWLNGQRLGTTKDWKQAKRFDVNALTRPGRNVIAIEVKNTDGPGGLLARLGFIPNGMSKLAVVSDGKWKCSSVLATGWQQPDFKDTGWKAAAVVGPYGSTEPWKTVAWEGGGDERFKLPAGFVVETVFGPDTDRKNLDPALPFSLINLCFDAKGRLLVSQERGPVLLCEVGAGKLVKPYCTSVKGCQGMCWVDDALLLVGDGPKGTGLYRVKDTDGDDRTDTCDLLLAVKGGMGEHGPHAIVHGPDDKLYLVIGNHAWAKVSKLAANSPLTRWPDGQMGPDQGKPGSTEDVLLPRLNDARGHAADIRAPGGTIWRLDKDGGQPALFAAGFRNHYDLCFNALGEIISYDSDMEWDEGLPWYRAPRVCHVFAGADFLWRTGAANTPDYYIDSLPPAAETPRGSPVGVECYQHNAFPEQYQGAVFLADWSAGKIFSLRLGRDSAVGRGQLEEFCVGTPLNITDLAVGPDGALYFTTGGRGTSGGIYRIVFTRGAGLSARGLMGMMRSGGTKADEALQVPQPWSAFGRARIKKLKKEAGEKWGPRLEAIIRDRGQPWTNRVRAMDYLANFGPPPSATLLAAVAFNETEDDMPLVCAHATSLLANVASAEAKSALVEAMHDGLPMVRRRACEGLVRAGIEPPLDDLWILLADQHRQNRTAARLVLQRFDPARWIEKFSGERSDYICMEAIVCLCKSNRAREFSRQIAARLAKILPSDDLDFQLDYLRVWQLVLLHCEQNVVAEAAREMLDRCARRFPPTDPRVAREIAILLTHGRRVGLIDQPVHALLLDALLREKDQAQQIHYFYCLRLLHQGWTADQRKQLLNWFEGTKNWQGGYSFRPFLENILRDFSPALTSEDTAWLLEHVVTKPHTSATVLRNSRKKLDLKCEQVLRAYDAVLLSGQPLPEVREGLITALARRLPSAEAQAALRKIGDIDLGQHEAVARGLTQVASRENAPYVLRGLASASPVTCLACLRALAGCDYKPAADDPKPYRLVLMATSRLDLENRKVTIDLLRRWTGKQFVPDDGDWKQELPAWGQWFAQAFPAEPPLPNAQSLGSSGKWKVDELLEKLAQASDRKPDLDRGKKLMTQANCYKCHKFGSEGEGIGPDLTTLRSKFKRRDLLEALLEPSKVISDQYRGSVLQTRNGKLYTGLVAPQGEELVVLQQDGTKVTLKKSEIESQVASTKSAMPERLLDEMTWEEIADLIAFLESTPR